MIYPVLGGLFFQSGIFIQALLIPVFFIVRAGFEYGADAITSRTFGSDGMPPLNFAGVLMHEICLSVMITSIKHPLVFASLVLSDVLENTFCLWSVFISFSQVYHIKSLKYHPFIQNLMLMNSLYQSAYTGMDMTMRFEWLKCRDEENSTWSGGFEWEC